MWLLQKEEKETIRVLVFTYMPWETNTWRRQLKLLDLTVSACDEKVCFQHPCPVWSTNCHTVERKVPGAVKKRKIFAFGCLFWANTLLTFLCTLWLKTISSSNKLCWCIFAQPTPTLHLHPSCHSARTKHLLLHLLSSFTANLIQLDSLFYICICVK